MNLIDLYIGHIAAEEKSLNTLAQYEGELRRFERWLKTMCSLSLEEDQAMRIKGVTLTMYYQYLHEQKLAITTRNNYVVILKEFFEFLKGVGAIPEDPSVMLHCIRAKEESETDSQLLYSVEEIEVLLVSISGRELRCNDLRDAAIIALILGSGLRASEVCNLNISHFSEIKRTGFVNCLRKGGIRKDVAVADFVVSRIEQYLLTRGAFVSDDPLFLSNKGNRLTRTALWKSLATKQRRVDLATGIHIFRHTLLTAVDHDGGSALARDVGGHKSLKVTNRYVHTSDKEKLTAVNSTPFQGVLAAHPHE